MEKPYEWERESGSKNFSIKHSIGSPSRTILLMLVILLVLLGAGNVRPKDQEQDHDQDQEFLGARRCNQ
jgi:hypothetical protein